MTSSIPRLTSLSHGGGCGCKIAPHILRNILKNTHGMPAPEQLSDPQTSGGLLITCAPNSVEEVLQIFHATGFETAAVIGQIRSGEGLEISV